MPSSGKGIEATANRNVSRFKSKGNKKQWKIHKSNRDGKPYKSKPPSIQSKAKLEKMNKETMKAYEQYAKKLPAGTVKMPLKNWLITVKTGSGDWRMVSLLGGLRLENNIFNDLHHYH
ncbi:MULTISPECIES: hypothetical protein [Moraxella]|uniref:Uncharacterized protein n=1 Tax=Moraxella oculi TaxID=2940516 RepID=A0ABW8U3P3_9GAMM